MNIWHDKRTGIFILPSGYGRFDAPYFEFTKGLDFSTFKKNRLVVDAVIRNFEIIGEASKNVPESVKIKFPNIPWKNMYKLRNIISHDYFGIDYEVVWNIITGYLPENYTELCRVIETEQQNLSN